MKSSDMGATATNHRDKRSRIPQLGVKLWSGFSTDAKADLEAVCGNGALGARARIAAAWHLARWASFHQGYEEALQYLRFISFLAPAQRLRKRHLLLEIEALLNLGRCEEARLLVSEASKS